MQRAVIRAAVVVAITALLSACTSDDPLEGASTTVPTTVPPPTTTPTTLPPSTTTTVLETTTTIEGQVGSPDALLDAMRLPMEASAVLYDLELDEIPVPGIDADDPLAATRELLEFEFWLYANSTLEEWADVLAVPDSPAWKTVRSNLAVLAGRIATFESGESYEILDVRPPSSEELRTVPAQVLDRAGESAKVVVYRTALAPHVIGDSAEPEFDEERAGWVDRSEISVVANTEIGWQWYWVADL